MNKTLKSKMKPKHVIIIAIIAALVILLVTNLKLGFSNNKQSCSISSTWNCSKSNGVIEGSTQVAIFEPTPIVVVYKNQRVGDINEQNPLIINISDKDFGPLWMPLYKKGQYNITVSVTHIKEINTSMLRGKLAINGSLKIDGDYRIVGTTSTKEASHMVIDKVLNTIYTEAKKKISDIEDNTIKEYPGLLKNATPPYLINDPDAIDNQQKDIPTSPGL